MRVRKYNSAKAAAASRKWRRDHPTYYIEYLRTYGKRWRADRKQKGLCVRCGIKLISGASCQSCKRDAKQFCATIRGIREEDQARALAAIQTARICGLCGSRTPNGRGWCIDHDHKTKRFRGVLCNNCNAGLGQFKDSPTLLKSAIKYLENS